MKFIHPGWIESDLNHLIKRRKDLRERVLTRREVDQSGSVLMTRFIDG